MCLAVAGGVLFVGTTLLWGEVSSNPYLSIVDRNPFSLKPIPPPPPPQEAPPPKPPAVQVKLTGITTVAKKTKVLVEITEGPGKPPKKQILNDGERFGDVEVKAIDVKNNTVTFQIVDVVTNITFEVAKSPAGPAPGPLPPGLVAPPVIPAPPPASPTTVNTMGMGPGGKPTGVLISGNSSPGASTATPAAGVTSYGLRSPAIPSYSASVGAATVGTTPSASVMVSDGSGLRNIPSRTTRAATTPDPVSTWVNWAATEQAAKQKNIPYPPTPPVPGSAPATPQPPMPQ